MAETEIKSINGRTLFDVTSRRRIGELFDEFSEVSQELLETVSDLSKNKANKADLTNPFNFKGSTTYAALPTSGNTINDTYYCTDLKRRYTWNGSAWYPSSLDESEYADELDRLEGEIAESENYILNNDKKYKTEWRIGGCDANTGVLANDKAYINTAMMKFEKTCIITYDQTKIAIRFVFFDDAETFVNAISFESGTNDERSHFIGANTNFIISAKLHDGTVINDAKNNDIFNNISIKECDFKKVYNGESFDITDIPFKKGYIDDYGDFYENNGYVFSSPIELKKGQKIEFSTRTSSAFPYAFICDSEGNYISTVGKGNGNFTLYSYTALEDCFVSIQFTTTSYKINNMKTKIYDIAECVKNSPLYKSVMAGIGDSLMKGNKLGQSTTWFNKIGEKYHMTYYNFGQNGSPIGIATNYDYSLSTNIDEDLSSINEDVVVQYFIILGGSGDKRLNVPIGTNDDTERNTFKGGLKYIINAVLTKYPKCKLLLLTNFNRFPTNNSLGLNDIDYVDAMKEVAEMYSLDCYDNYRKSGLSFQNPLQLAWIDEGLSLGLDENHHFSDEANTWLTTRYIKELERL